jgi:hypothetical protein
MQRIKFTEFDLMKYRNKFMSYVKKTSSCWLWVGGKGKDGSGHFSCGDIKKQAISYRAHRIGLYFFTGYIAQADENIVRTCGNAACVNPAHLKKVKERK